MEAFNIVELIEKNPISRLSGTYQNRLLTKIKEKFTEKEQQLFVASFYCYLNYDRKDFVVDLNDVWKWLKFSTKQKAKELLERTFIIDIDYKKSLNLQVKRSNHLKGGQNKEIILLTIDTFKKYCLKAGTKRADEIHEYYIKLEETIQESVQEESDELKRQLEEKTVEIKQTEQDRDKIRERTLLEQFPNNTQCVYYGMIDNVGSQNEPLIKFGNSNNLKNRVKQHKDTYLNFRLINAFRVDNKLQIENAIKEHPLFSERQCTITVKGKKLVEIIQMNGLTIIELDKIIRDIITGIEYSPENYIKILEQNRTLKRQLDEQNKTDPTYQMVFLSNENKRLQLENTKLLKKYNTLIRKPKTQPEFQEQPIQEQIPPINENTNILQMLKRITKNKDGNYVIEGKTYEKLSGSRAEVWSEKAYRTSGNLVKSDLMMNQKGAIISKKKSLQETMYDRFSRQKSTSNI
jgi:hypothetical protein